MLFSIYDGNFVYFIVIYRKINLEEKKRDVFFLEVYKKLVYVFCYLLCLEIDF